MARDDGSLFTGAHSQSVRSQKVQEIQEKRREALEEKQRRRESMFSSGDMIMAELASEIDRITKEPYPDEDAMTDEQFRIERRARRLTVARLMSIKTRVANLARSRPKKELTDGED